MRIDLHAHSAISDGTDSPRDLVAKAKTTGLDVLAITDHDTTAGWDEAATAADEHGIRLVLGIEISTSNLGKGAHLLAYGADPTDPALANILARGSASRDSRVPLMIARLASIGMTITPEAVARHAGGGVSGRPHVADALVEAGYVTSRDEAFDTLLGRGMPGYAKRWQADIEDALAAVRRAGGISVLAHPWGHGGHVTPGRFAALESSGLDGIEVDHEDHSPAQRAELREIAASLHLLVTGSSDHHGTGKVGHALGCNTTDPEQFERLVSLNDFRRDSIARGLPF